MYLRLYDWGVAHKTSPAGCHWRYEAELKGSRATQAAALLRSADVVDLAIRGLVYSLYTDRRIPVEWSPEAPAIKLPPSTRSTRMKRLAWLSKLVRPSVQRLVADGQLVAVIKALGLSEHVRCNPTYLR